ncbi:hypothetical protein BDV18DRAFT_164394 [Aspergillus unguis]
MQQEARNTKGGNIWRSNIQFRHKAVQFVSAGNLEPALEPKPDQMVGEALLGSTDHTSDTENASQIKSNADTVEGVMMATSPVLPVRSPSTTYEDSSEDEVIFRGRRIKPAMGPGISPHTALVDDSALSKELNDKLLPPTYIPAAPAVTPGTDETSTPSKEPPTDRKPVKDNIANSLFDASDDDCILADYIAHIDDDDDDSESNDTSSSPAQHNSPNESQPTSGGLTRTITDERVEVDSDLEDLVPAELLDTEPQYSPSGPSGSARRKADINLIAPATAFADALELDPYYGLDMMDFSRPSLRKNKKKQATLGLDAYDIELGDDLLNAWKNDKLRKKSKKREREELRAQGLLGRRKNDPDLKIKYADGINIEDLKSEIRSFLLSSKNRYASYTLDVHLTKTNLGMAAYLYRQ